jgi:hypothetical protein
MIAELVNNALSPLLNELLRVFLQLCNKFFARNITELEYAI